jgi:acetyltransferase-like isoleucine patch superfamily enzyme/dTDP-4-dehydrorhamnose 3,5-epimerase-like enzyme
MTSQALQIQKGPFVEISPEAQVGFGCTFGSHCFVHKGAVVGANVHIEGGVILHEGVAIEDGVEIGANVVFVRPRNTIGAPATLICRCSQIGGNATLAAGVTVGEQALVEPGSVVLNSVQPYAIVAGNPAKVVGFRGASVAVKMASPATPAGQGLGMLCRVRGVRLFELPFISDPRGNLTVGEFEKTIPFRPLRYFITFDVPNARIRGEHAHRECEQFLICVRGSCAVVVDDGQQREEILLDRPTLGIYVPPMIWATEYKHTSDSTLMVFASEYYDPEDYIRNYAEFTTLIGKEQ